MYRGKLAVEKRFGKGKMYIHKTAAHLKKATTREGGGLPGGDR